MQAGQLAGAIQIRIEPGRGGAETSVLVFGPSRDPQLAARGRELKNMLGIRPELRELKVNYGGYSQKDDEMTAAFVACPGVGNEVIACPVAGPGRLRLDLRPGAVAKGV